MIKNTFQDIILNLNKYWSDNGCVFEEVSTTHFNDDSIYNDKKINDMKREERKTSATNWGRTISA